MNKSTKIKFGNAIEYGNYSLSISIYGYVNDGVTTITKIGDIEAYISSYKRIHKDYFPSYITINRKKYNWIIDETDSYGYVTSAHVDVGSKIVINNPILIVPTFAHKGDEEHALTYFSFYSFPGGCVPGINSTITDVALTEVNKKHVTGNRIYSNGELSSYYGNTIIDGKNNFKMSYNRWSTTSSGATSYGYKFIVGETYRFVWELGSRSMYQDVVATSEYNVISNDCIIPQSWCDQLILPHDDNAGLNENPSLIVVCAMMLDGKPLSEWAELAGGYDTDISQYLSINAEADASLLPSISSVTLSDTNGVVPSTWKEFVQNLSNVAISSISCSGNAGSYITGVKIDVNNVSASGTLSSLPKTKVITNYGEFDVTVTVTDSRNRTASKSSKITFLPYSAPNIIAVNSQRCTKDGTIDNDGTFLKATGNPVYSSCNGHNSYHVYVSYKRTNQSTYSAEQEVTLPQVVGTEDSTTKLGNFDTEYSYDIRYRITDAINSVYYVDYLSTAVMMMHFMRGGRGVAFGQKATVEYCVDTSFNALFRGNVGFEINKKFYTIEQIINALEISGVDSLSWVENNKKEF